MNGQRERQLRGRVPTGPVRFVSIVPDSHRCVGLTMSMPYAASQTSGDCRRCEARIPRVFDRFLSRQSLGARGEANFIDQIGGGFWHRRCAAVVGKCQCDMVPRLFAESETVPSQALPRLCRTFRLSSRDRPNFVEVDIDQPRASDHRFPVRVLALKAPVSICFAAIDRNRSRTPPFEAIEQRTDRPHSAFPRRLRATDADSEKAMMVSSESPEVAAVGFRGVDSTRECNSLSRATGRSDGRRTVSRFFFLRSLRPRGPARAIVPSVGIRNFDFVTPGSPPSPLGFDLCPFRHTITSNVSRSSVCRVHVTTERVASMSPCLECGHQRNGRQSFECEQFASIETATVIMGPEIQCSRIAPRQFRCWHYFRTDSTQTGDFNQT